MSATNSTGADISHHIFTPEDTTVVHSWTHPSQSNQDGDPIVDVYNSDRYDSSSKSASSEDIPSSQTPSPGLPINFNCDIPVPRTELELPREWWLNETKIEDPDRDPYKLTHGGYNLKDPIWWDDYEPGDLDRLALPRVEELFNFLRQQLKASGDARAGDTLAPPSAPTGEGPTRSVVARPLIPHIASPSTPQQDVHAGVHPLIPHIANQSTCQQDVHVVVLP